MKSVLDMPVMQVRDRIGDYMFAFAHFPLRANFPLFLFRLLLLFRERGKNFFLCARANETRFANISWTRERVK
jgi:hypothetical protein